MLRIFYYETNILLLNYLQWSYDGATSKQVTKNLYPDKSSFLSLFED